MKTLTVPFTNLAADVGEEIQLGLKHMELYGLIATKFVIQ
jgi:hypothetical protein